MALIPNVPTVTPRCESSTCVEVMLVNGLIRVRDTKNKTGLYLFFTPEEWINFTGGVRDGDFDLVLR